MTSPPLTPAAERTLPLFGRVEIALPLRLVSEANARGHWGPRARRAREQRGLVRLALRTHRKPPLPVRVTITRIAPRELDDDNLRGAAKATRDGVADWLGVDDRDRRITWAYAQERGRVREYGVRILVEGIA